MNILQLTPGTGNFHCGSCLRDHAFLKALQDLGHDVVMVPMYLPLVTENENIGSPADDIPIFFGGVNIYLQTKFALFRHTPRWLDRMLDSNKLLMTAAGKIGMTKPRELGELTVVAFEGADGKQRKEVERLAAWIQETQKPDVLVLSNCLLAGLAPHLKETVGCPIVCVLQGEDTFLEDLPEPYRTQSWDLLHQRSASIDLAIAVSDYHASIMRPRLACDVAVVHNGIDLTGYSERDAAPDPPVIGTLARQCATKGLHRLVDAFIELDHPTARLHAVGTRMPTDEPFVAEQRAKLEAAGLADRVTFSPNVTRAEKIEALRGMTLLSVPALYGESFGLYLLEAAACGVPVIQPRHAAFPEVVSALQNGLLYDPDTPGALTDALRTALSEPAATQALGDAGARNVRERFHIRAVTEDFVRHLESCAIDDVKSS